MLNLDKDAVMELVSKELQREVSNTLLDMDLETIIKEAVEDSVENMVKQKLNKEFWTGNTLEEVFSAYLSEEFKGWVYNNYWNSSMLAMAENAITSKMASLSFEELRELVDYIVDNSKGEKNE